MSLILLLTIERMKIDQAFRLSYFFVKENLSFSIRSLKNLRESYVQLKGLLDDCNRLVQTIGSGNFLSYDNVQILKRDNEQIQEEFFRNVRSIETLIEELLRNQKIWSEINEELVDLENFFAEIVAQLENKSFNEKPIDDKEKIVEVRREIKAKRFSGKNFLCFQNIRSLFSKKQNSLSSLIKESSKAESSHFRSRDFAKVLNRINKLKADADSTSNKILREEENLAECRTHVQAARRFIDQLEPWLEKAEIYLEKRFQQTGVANCLEAKNFFEKHRVNIVFIDSSQIGLHGVVNGV